MKRQGSFQLHSLQAHDRRSFTRLMSAVWRQLGRWHALHCQRQQLAAMSDAMLKDIGLSRADIETEISRPFWDEPFCRR